MCGILATTRGIEDLPNVIEFLRFRGPDQTNLVNVNGINFVHTLLSMTGPPTIQPFLSEDKKVVAFFNGEIYNFNEFGDYQSDGECLVPLYLEHGIDFVQKLDGEFALAVADFNNDTLIFSTDVFSMKPLWFAKEGSECSLSSYTSCNERE